MIRRDAVILRVRSSMRTPSCFSFRSSRRLSMTKTRSVKRYDTEGLPVFVLCTYSSARWKSFVVNALRVCFRPQFTEVSCVRVFPCAAQQLLPKFSRYFPCMRLWKWVVQQLGVVSRSRCVIALAPEFTRNLRVYSEDNSSFERPCFGFWLAQLIWHWMNAYYFNQDSV